MADKKFSLEKHLEVWQAAKDTVTVEGVVLDDGDWWVIDPDPTRPGVLYRVRKADVTDRKESRKVGGEHQLHTVRIKKAAAVMRMSVVVAEEVARLGGTISATFRNDDNVFSKHWIVRDKRSGQIVINQDFAPEQEVTVSLAASSAGYGDVRYWKQGQNEEEGYDPGLIADGDVVSMFG